MGSNWWIVAETLKAREKDIAALYERCWNPNVDEAGARRGATSRARPGRALRWFFELTRAPRAAVAADATCPCSTQGLACC